MSASPAGGPVRIRNLDVVSGHSTFEIELAVPASPLGVVLMVRGNRIVVDGQSIPAELQRAGLATATCQILTWLEIEHDFARHETIANADVLTGRLASMLDALRSEPDVAGLPIGLLGSAGLAAAMLQLAARRPLDVDAVVCRDGRVSHAAGTEYVRAPTLLLVTGASAEVLRQNDDLFGRLTCAKDLVVMTSANARPDARAERIALERTRDWLLLHLRTAVYA